MDNIDLKPKPNKKLKKEINKYIKKEEEEEEEEDDEQEEEES